MVVVVSTRIFFLLTVLGVTVSSQGAKAAAWTQPKGKGLIITTLAYSFAENNFDDNGSLEDRSRFEKLELRPYLEYGLRDWATLVAQPEFRFKSLGDGPGEEVTGFGRADLGVRIRLKQIGPWVLSTQGSVRAPGARDDLAPANGGDTEWELDGRALAGRGFEAFGRHAFVDLQLGYRHRFDDPPNELRFDLTTGIDLTDKTQVFLQSFTTISTGSGDNIFEGSDDNKVSLSGVWKVTPVWSLQAGVLQTVIGRNALQETGGFFAIWRSF